MVGWWDEGPSSLECSTWWYLRPLAPICFKRDLPVNPLKVKPLAKDLSTAKLLHCWEISPNLLNPSRAVADQQETPEKKKKHATGPWFCLENLRKPWKVLEFRLF